MPFGRKTPFRRSQPIPTWSKQWVRRLETVGTTPKQRHTNMAATGCEPPPHMAAHSRRAVSRWNSIGGVAHRRPTAVSHKWAVDERTAGSAAAMAAACRRRSFRTNRIKASLRAFQRWKVKVLGFDVKARLRPQRMALRRYQAPFALVGAIGEACGEASRVSVSDTPPFFRGCLPPVLGAIIATRRLDA